MYILTFRAKDFKVIDIVSVCIVSVWVCGCITLYRYICMYIYIYMHTYIYIYIYFDKTLLT